MFTTTKVLNFLLLLFPVFQPSETFWWRSNPTEAPSTPGPLMQQIPLTYFRTYTYQQPLPNNQIQIPLLSSTDYITNNKSPYFNPFMNALPLGISTKNEIPMLETRPMKSYGNFNVVRSLSAEPSTTSTTTTTTTTTTPAPTTTTTTDTPTTLPIEGTNSAKAYDAFDNIDSTYPPFTRKAFTNHFNINYNRPVYPYPEYSINKGNSRNKNGPPTPNFEFVPCMCPVNIHSGGFSSGYQSGLPIVGNSLDSIFLAQGRTNIEAENFQALPEDDVPLNDVTKIMEDTSNSVDDLQIVKLNEAENTPTLAPSTLT